MLKEVPQESQDVELKRLPAPIAFMVPRQRSVRTFTDDEIVRIRAMLEAFEKIATECPVAARLLIR